MVRTDEPRSVRHEPMTVAEVARALGVSHRTITITEARALAKLRKALIARGVRP